jgi:hypothetical protein
MNTNANISILDHSALSAERMRTMLTLLPSVPDGLRSTSEQVREAIRGLPYLQEDELVALGEKGAFTPLALMFFININTLK